MSDQPEQPTPDDLRKANADCQGAPRYFTYPEPLPISDDERKRYDEIAAKYVAPKRRARRSRR